MPGMGRRLPSREGSLLAEWMSLALEEAREAGRKNEVPVGAVIVDRERVIARAHNEMVGRGDPTAHAERLVIEAARGALHASGQDDSGYLSGLTLVVTLEPCAMCAGAIVLSRVGRLVFGAWDEKAGMCGSVGDIVRHPRLNHRPEVVGGVMAKESAELLRDFFAERRGG